MRALDSTRSWFASVSRRWLPQPKPRWPALSPVAARVERMVHLLDSAIPIPGTRFRLGLDPLLGLALPAVGDTVAGAVSLSMLFLAVQYRVPTPVIGKMVFNVAIDAAVGSIPIVGDIFDFGFKANDRNFDMLMRHRGDLPKRTSPRYWLAVTGLFAAGLACVVAPLALLIWALLAWQR
jgi:hypothetical protein